MNRCVHHWRQLLAGVVLSLVQPCYADALIGPFTSEDGTLSLLLGADSEQDVVLLEKNRLESITARVEAGCEPTQLTFDANMPAHGHGMITKSRVQTQAPGSFRIDGIKLHMGGHWVLSVTVQCGGKPYAFDIPYDL